MLQPTNMKTDTVGNLYIVCSEDHTIRKIDISTNIITTFRSR
jgi:hypothetical protein